MALTTTSLRLRQLRLKRSLSQLDVADFLGITRTAYNKYENGVIQPTRTAVKLAKLFGVSTDFILGIDVSENHQMIADTSAEKQVKKYLALSKDSRYIVDTLVNELYRKEQPCRAGQKRGVRNEQ